jgi:hypothetical protein
MSILKGALGLLAAGTAVAAFKAAKNASRNDPLVAAGAVIVGTAATSAAVHTIADEVGELRRRARNGRGNG